MQLRSRALFTLVATQLSIGCQAPSAPPSSAEESAAIDSNTVEADDYLLVRPSRDDGPETLLVLFPGANLAPESYVDLAEALQQATPFRLWVGIARFAFNTPQPLQAQGRFDEVEARARSEGFASPGHDRVFLAGHSLGGIFAKDVAKNEQLAGLLLLGSYLPKMPGSPSLAAFPRPLLTLGGELDGRSWITRIAEEVEAQAAIAQATSEAEAAVDKPVIVLPGVTHFQFAGGEPDSEDLAPEIPLDVAHQRIAAAMGDFLAARVLPATQPAAVSARASLAAGIADTRLRLAGYRAAQALDHGGWCEAAQAQEAGVDPALLAVSDTEYQHTLPFSASKPELTVGNGAPSVHTTSLLAWAPDPIDTSTNIAEAPVALACKLKNREVVSAALPSQTPTGTASCGAINQAALAWALDHVLPEARDRYLSRGKPLQFLDDQARSTGVTWLAAPLSFERSRDGSHVEVQAQSLHTDENAPFGLGGMHYCKLLAPSRAVEWVLVDGLKK
jgi:hypothetical protein